MFTEFSAAARRGKVWKVHLKIGVGFVQDT